MSHRVPFAALAAGLCLLVAPAAASANVSLSAVVAHPISPGSTCNGSAPVNAPAGSHSDLCVAFDVSSGTAGQTAKGVKSSGSTPPFGLTMSTGPCSGAGSSGVSARTEPTTALKVGQRMTFAVTAIKLNGKKVSAKAPTRARA